MNSQLTAEQHTGTGGRGSMVVFDGVTTAVDVAVTMQQALSARPEDAEPLAIRVGVEYHGGSEGQTNVPERSDTRNGT